MTATTGKIFAAIPAIMSEVGAVGKNEKNTQQGYRHRSADDVCDAVRALMGRHGVFPTKKIVEHTEAERESRNGGRLLWVKLKCLWTFHASDGSSVETESFGEGMDSGDKATNKAETGSMKNAIIQVFQLMGHEDSEVDSPAPEASHQPAKKQSKPSAKDVAAEHGLKTADQLGPSDAFKKAMDKITAAVQARDVNEVARICNVAEKARDEGKITPNEATNILNEFSTALKKINAANKEDAQQGAAA